jgi:hypothetical protein
MHRGGVAMFEVPVCSKVDGFSVPSSMAHVNDLIAEVEHGAEGAVLDPNCRLFRVQTIRSSAARSISARRPPAYRMITRRARAAGIWTRIGKHSFRATGVTEYLKNGGKLEMAQAMAAHERARATGLYDRRDDLVSLDEVERIVI